jgi:hypothetical protein
MCVYIKKKYNNKLYFRDINDLIGSIDSFDKFYYQSKKSQLFSKGIPSFDFVKKLIFELLNKEINENIYYEFSIKNLINKNILNKIDIFIPELKNFYLKCKHEKYLENLNEKKIVTILRQLLRPYDYIISSIEKYDNGNKYLLYVIQKKNNFNLKKINSTLNFD